LTALPRLLEARRSIRTFLPEPVPRADLDALVTAACIAPAPHHSRPWRWVVLDGEPARRNLALAMGAAWRVDLERDGLDRYPDETRRRAEYGMALLSLGAAVENLMLAATDRGYASCWVAAPIFCPETARDALALPPDWLPHALVLVGRPDPTYVGRERPPVPLDDLRAFR
jgi:coenzyme F420-0:L-glutamate ligase/coenzyme F420-1:gamma-L-glutamate ligase